jgi:hypothetical protein
MGDNIMILIVGVGRSGTTLIREILNKHPNVNIAPETSFYNRLWASRKLLGSIKIRHNVPKWLYYLLFHSHDPSMENYKFLLFDLVSDFENNPPHSYEEMFQRILEKFAKSKNKRIYGEKTPNHIFYIDHIKKRIPKTKIIVTIRDPRAVTSSMIKRGDLYNKAYQPAIEWYIGMEKIFKLLEFHREDLFIIKYEDLIDDSYTVIKDLCKFLNIEFYEDMLIPEETNTSFKELKGRKGIYKDAKEKWREILSKDDIKTVERICSNLMKEFGYTTDNSNILHYLTPNELYFKLFLDMNIKIGNIGFRPFRAYLNNIFMGKIKL